MKQNRNIPIKPCGCYDYGTPCDHELYEAERQDRLLIEHDQKKRVTKGVSFGNLGEILDKALKKS